MKSVTRQPSSTERIVCLVILTGLVAVAGGILIKQSRFNPAVLAVATASSAKADAPAPAHTGFAAFMPPELVVFGPPESFNEETLSDKINGKADLYLQAGFVQMHCQRFALAGSQEDWMEWFVYDMGNLRQAFSVFSLQRRAEAQPLGLTRFAYTTKNALFFVSGRNYIEAVAATANEKMMKALVAMAQNYIAANPPEEVWMPELDLFPPENLVPNSVTLQISTAFGFDQFRNVFAAKYNVEGAEVLAFVTILDKPEAAAALRDAYFNFLLSTGGRALSGGPWPHEAKAVESFEGTEIVFNRGTVVAGVHAAPNQNAAQKVAAALERQITAHRK